MLTTTLILTCVIFGALGRRLQGGWFPHSHWLGFPLYAAASLLCAYPLAEPLGVWTSLAVSAGVMVVSTAWFTVKTNNGHDHWCAWVRALYGWAETCGERVPAMPLIGVEGGAYTSVCELIIGGSWFFIISAVCSITALAI